MKKKCFVTVVECFKNLYTPTNCVAIDNLSNLENLNDRTIIFLEMDFKDLKFSVDFKFSGLEFHERFCYDESKINVEEIVQRILFIIEHNIKEYNNNNAYDVYFTIKRSDEPNNFYKNEDFETFVCKIKKFLDKNLLYSLLTDYFPFGFKEYFSKRIGLNGFPSSSIECISIRKQQYCFLAFIDEKFKENVKEQLELTLNEIEIEDLRYKASYYLKKPFDDLSIKEKERLYILSIFYDIKMFLKKSAMKELSFVNYINFLILVRYLTNKMDFFKNFLNLFEGKYYLVRKLNEALAVFESENQEFIQKKALDENIRMAEKILNYLEGILTDISFPRSRSEKLVGAFFEFLVDDMVEFKKIIMSDDVKENSNVTIIKTNLRYLNLNYWEEFIASYIKYIKKEGSVSINETNYFETLKDECISFALIDLNKGFAVTPYFYLQAKEYFKNLKLNK
ncbi:hypothetical protein NGRA_0947 [Nosema granulosis]|uniref:Uncharacterized protein n=1 Tax=Nosema granulosis TaxID=83296 RepID=A0A9P6KZK2_9MICR|nr:hypothetical protein NGRA_0947 [Nosema granulosis]